MSEQPAARSDLTVTEVDDELLVLDEAAGKVHQLNATAALVFRCCDGNTSVAEISQRLVAQFDVDPAVASTDVAQLLDTLRTSQLLSD